jgi:hypothetical protein
MIAIIEREGIKETLPLVTFINALDNEERGYRWEDLKPDAVSMVVWLELREAYTLDEGETDAWKAERRNEYYRGEGGDYRVADGNGGGFVNGSDFYTD